MSLKASKSNPTSATSNTNITNSNGSSNSSTNTNSNSSSSSRDLIKVCVRIRPPPATNNNGNNNNNLDTNDNIVWKWDEQSIAPAITNPIRKGATNSFSTINAEYFLAQQQQYSFDHVFAPETTTSHIFDSVVKDIVSSAMQGMHGSVFMYGQTASGKTFTMNGTSGHNPQIGIIPQAVRACFEAIDLFPDREFLIRVSYLEVYNEQLKDLLNPEPVNIKILHDPKQNITILTGVKEQVVLNFAQVHALMKQGESQRHVGVTDMNEKSSRAHTIFKIIIESKDRSHQHGPVRVSTLNLIDLAGSESAKMTNSKGQRLQEARHINQSLLALSTIIQRLSEEHSHNRRLQNINNQNNNNNNVHQQHLPFRDSKLTRLLETALDGNGKIAIICTISPTLKCVEETSNTLKFGARAKLIQMHAKINETVDDKTLLRAYREEIEQLKHRLKELEEKNHMNNSHNLSETPFVTNTNNNNNNKNDNFVAKNEDNDITAEDEDTCLAANESDDDDDNDDNDDDNDEDLAVAAEQNAMLQMILEMERLILKADMTKHAKTNALSVSPSSSSVSSLLSVNECVAVANRSDNATCDTNDRDTVKDTLKDTVNSKLNLKPATDSGVAALQSPATRGKNGEKRLCLSKLTSVSQSSSAQNSSKTPSTSLNHTAAKVSAAASRVTPGTQTKTRVVSLTKLAASSSAAAATNNFNNSNNFNKTNKTVASVANATVSDTATRATRDTPSKDTVSESQKNIAITQSESETAAEDTSRDSVSSVKKKPNLTINSGSVDDNLDDNLDDNVGNKTNDKPSRVSSNGINKEDVTQQSQSSSSIDIDIDIVKSQQTSDMHDTVSRTVASSVSHHSNLPNALTQFSPAVMASLQLNNLLLRTSPSSAATTSQTNNGVFFAGRSADVSSPRSNQQQTNPKIADVYSQMAVTASEAGVAPPASPPVTTSSHLTHHYPDLPGIPDSHSRPHPQMLLLSPARQRLQQHLQQHQHLARSFYNNNNFNNNNNNVINSSSIDNKYVDQNQRIDSNDMERTENNSLNNSVYRMLSSDSFDFHSSSEKKNVDNVAVDISDDVLRSNNDNNNSGSSNANVQPHFEETDTVLLNVSKMLLLLKDYIAKPKQTR